MDVDSEEGRIITKNNYYLDKNHQNEPENISWSSQTSISKLFSSSKSDQENENRLSGANVREVD